MACAEEPATRFWGENEHAALFRKVFVYGFGAAALVSAGIGLGFQEDAISKENARRDFVRQHGNTLYLSAVPGGVQQVGPQCKGVDQCNQYKALKDGRDNSYNLMTGFYAAAAGSAFGATLMLVSTYFEGPWPAKMGTLAPTLVPGGGGMVMEGHF
jgi:hypothetical protein